ncbi:MAG TPA: imidazole glycerol phosphate synthase subunit HisH [Agitococcus sp.]|nr:imidazole glycerol phosphate synthase subunit HisH [Agitococcus sp.]HNB19493.1 imidazole glycerol phosphate synthase subunit HisH [Agitococcus sp.]HNL36582.1 imidazole glycerol phosphate synthase subunit HisH [Agitococcus sp.]HNL79212.1 imidazole glycerol phosphate synthase subunit HisH [Agitococcus sp.]HNP02161.1 imidazole glycerol phosphate synthase subunit HisH [Agitococcus sp.]
MTTVAVLDYGMGNLHSVAKALEHVGASKVIITHDPALVRAADRVVFPGVGAMRDCMAGMKAVGVDAEVREAASQKPVLAICVGMQALMEHSEENGGVDCLAMFNGQVKFFGNDLVENGQRLKVPHMGWNEVNHTIDHALWQDIPQNSRFYFVHSFYVDVADSQLIAGRSHYGLDFTTAISHDNLFAVQFHPEKSQKMGLQLLKNFVEWRV